MVTLSEWYVQNTHKGFMCNNCGKLVNKSDMERYLVARVQTGSGFHQSCGIGIGSGLASNPAGSQPGSRPRRPGPSWTPRSPWRALQASQGRKVGTPLEQLFEGFQMSPTRGLQDHQELRQVISTSASQCSKSSMHATKKVSFVKQVTKHQSDIGL